MGLRYLRGPTPSAAGIADSTRNYVRTSKEFALFMFYYLRRILGYTYVEEVRNPSSTWVYDTAHEHTAADGVLTNTDYTFTSAAALFLVGDVGKYLVIVDSTNESNCGIYQVATFVSATQVTINFLTTVGTFPTASTGITWYLIDGDTAGDPYENDYFVLEVPHATSPYTMKCRMLGHTTGSGVGIEISPQAGAWDSGANDWLTSATPRLSERRCTRGFVNSAHGRVFGVGHTDGSLWMVWDHNNAATGQKEGAGVCILNALESSPTVDVKELIYGFGQGTGVDSSESSAWTRSITDNNRNLAYGTVYRNIGNAIRQAWWMGWQLTGVSDLFRQNISTNARTGDRDALPIWVLRAPDENQHFAPWGEIPHMVLGTVFILGEHVSFDTDLRFHVRDGVVIPWPGIPFA